MSESIALRPAYFREIVGLASPVNRITQAIRNGRIPRRLLFWGPTGSGKTTLAQIVGRRFICLGASPGDPEPCGKCERCRKELDSCSLYHEWKGVALTDRWTWWEQHGQTVLSHPDNVFFLDEAQDLQVKHQQYLRTDIEEAKAVVIFATTHLNELNEALIKRFGNNFFELKRPTPQEVAAALSRLCRAQQVVFEREEQLVRIANQRECDMRLCTDLVVTAAAQALNKTITDQFLDEVLGKEQKPVTKPSGARVKELI